MPDISTYEGLLAAYKKHAEDNAPVIRAVKAAGAIELQPVLWIKGAFCPHFEGGEARTFRGHESMKDGGLGESTFGFTEPLVNQLMLAAYLMGAKSVDERSYRKGWEDGTDAARKALEAL